MVWPDPKEVAVLTVDGMKFSDWETVMVKHEIGKNPYYTYRFTCSEPLPMAKNGATLQIVPGMVCGVTLGGEPAVEGYVCTRQVFYDSKRHRVEIMGASSTLALASASIVSPTGEFKNVTYSEYAKKLLKDFPGMQFLEEGGALPTDKFDKISNPPGTTVLEGLETPLRSLGGYLLTTNIDGDVVCVAGPVGEDSVTEGKDILEAREILYMPGMASGTYLAGQRPGTNRTWGAGVASVPFFGNSFQSMAPKYAPQLSLLETPAWQNKYLQNRSEGEKKWQQEDQITVFVTVRGWMRPSGGLWRRSQVVKVFSPMLLMNGDVELWVRSATFTQDNQTGTRTVLELCNKLALEKLFGPQPGQ